MQLHEGALRLAVVADTHSHPHPRATELLLAEHPHAILHAGDIGDRAVLDQLGTIAPVAAVRGNIDGHGNAMPDVRVIDVLDDERILLLRLLLLHIAVNGPRLRADARRMARAESASLVVCGHSHVPFMGKDGEFFIFNPGSAGPRRFHLPILFGVIDVTRDGVRMKHVDCETGREWHP